ncbi:uncharacterized protein LOC123806085 isoform X2 [Phyllostomus hastatus]|uniref:uncharacterized protein LOC123806085 isoform X2 n=1 Tax=Phyllostomus hastatus TaxID=9423 RepID=UPI001E684D72|nr:uncharacterized protein LOC123806085 isoform X2 [Phyllostomus hastatus]
MPGAFEEEQTGGWAGRMRRFERCWSSDWPGRSVPCRAARISCSSKRTPCEPSWIWWDRGCARCRCRWSRVRAPWQRRKGETAMGALARGKGCGGREWAFAPRSTTPTPEGQALGLVGGAIAGGVALSQWLPAGLPRLLVSSPSSSLLCPFSAGRRRSWRNSGSKFPPIPRAAQRTGPTEERRRKHPEPPVELDLTPR